MTSAEMAAYGAEGTWALVREHEIRWSERDLYGHVNHAAYLTLFEDLRADYWRAISGTDLSSAQPGPVMAQLEIRYANPVGFHDLRTVDGAHGLAPAHQLHAQVRAMEERAGLLRPSGLRRGGQRHRRSGADPGGNAAGDDRA
jgi:hypothetical protein